MPKMTNRLDKNPKIAKERVRGRIKFLLKTVGIITIKQKPIIQKLRLLREATSLEAGIWLILDASDRIYIPMNVRSEAYSILRRMLFVKHALFLIKRIITIRWKMKNRIPRNHHTGKRIKDRESSWMVKLVWEGNSLFIFLQRWGRDFQSRSLNIWTRVTFARISTRS